MRFGGEFGKMKGEAGDGTKKNIDFVRSVEWAGSHPSYVQSASKAEIPPKEKR